MPRSYVLVLLAMDTLLLLLIAAFVFSIDENGRWTIAGLSALVGAAAVGLLVIVSDKGVEVRRSSGAMALATAGGLLASELLTGAGEAIFLGTICGFLVAFALVLNVIPVARGRARDEVELPTLSERDVSAGMRAETDADSVRVLGNADAQPADFSINSTR